MEKTVLYAGTRNLYERMLAGVKSLLINTPEIERVVLFIEDDTFPFWLPECVETVNVADQQYFPKSSPNYHKVWTYMSMMRVTATKYFPDLNRLLYLDVDTIVCQNVAHLWNLDMTDYYIAGVQDNYPSYHGWPYCNAGVLVMNLKKLREDGVDDMVIDALNKLDLRYPEQDALSLFCREKTLLLPSDYNASAVTDKTDNIIIRHYAAIQKFWYDNLFQKYNVIPWEQIMLKRGEPCR